MSQNQIAKTAESRAPEVPVAQPSPSERFTNAVIKEFSSNNGAVELTPFQKKLCQNYFIKIDMVLKDAEQKRLSKPEQYRDPAPLTWDNINLQKLATDVIIYSSVGMDPTQPNHINPIPFKNNRTGKYDIQFIVGYKGNEVKARKYGLDVPDDVIVELVYSKDKFKPVKKDLNNKVEGYVFEQSEDLDRGEVVGGFWYHVWHNTPEKNKLKTFSKKDIDKRKPSHASAEFWGGEKEVWVSGESGRREKKTVEVDGWYEEMAYKTIHRNAFNTITIDSEKIDSNYLAIIMRESESIDNQVAQEIAENANRKVMEIEDTSIVQDVTGAYEPTMIVSPVQESEPVSKTKVAPF